MSHLPLNIRVPIEEDNPSIIRMEEKCIKSCINELKTRFLVNMQKFNVYKITKGGIENVSVNFNEFKE